MQNQNISTKTLQINHEQISKQIKSSAKKLCSAKLYTYDWLQDITHIPASHNLVEVRFKNTRKEFYENSENLSLEVGDIVAVESSPGHDIGVISLTGELVIEQIKKNSHIKKNEIFGKIYRKARPTDIEKWEEAKALEHSTMIKARQITKKLKLAMKIGDVEYQGDKAKAIFYYIADERVDFRELIKILADEFKIRIEMKQIGARQEAGRIGGIGPCGRDLCCSSFMPNFVSVSTTSARYQEVSLNPQKLAGQCGKLKCCLNFEVDSYIDARKDFPHANTVLKFEEGEAILSKTDVYKRLMWFVLREEKSTSFIELSVDDVNTIIELNKQGKTPAKPESQSDQNKIETEAAPDFTNVVGQESLTRFDKKRKPKHDNRQAKQMNTQTDKDEQRNRPKRRKKKTPNQSNPS